MSLAALLHRADECLSKGANEEALGLCREILCRDENCFSAWHRLGLVYLRQGRHDEAAQALTRATQAPAASADVFNDLGSTLAGQKRYPEAVTAFRRAIDVDGTSATAHYNLGNALRFVRDHANALMAYRSAERFRPDWAELHFNLGNTLRDLKDPESAVRSYKHAIRLRPTYTKALNNLGNLYRSQGNCAKAIKCFRLALEINPQYAEAAHNLGTALRSQGRVEDSIACFLRALKRNPEDITCHLQLAIALRAAGRLNDAARTLARAIQLEPRAACYLELGIVQKDQRRYAEAIESLKAACELGEDSAELHLQMGDVLRLLHRTDDSLEHFNHVLVKSPRSVAGLNLKGVTLFAAGRLRDAIACYTEALRMAHDNHDVHNNLGTALLLLNEHAAAMRHFEHALRLKPDFALAHLNRALAWLRAGEFISGWLEFEWRKLCPEYRPRDYGRPLWDGSPKPGQTVLLHAEQGLGDTFQFIRYAAVAAREGTNVVVEAQAPVVGLVGRCQGVSRAVARGQALPDYQWQSPLMSLPSLVNTTLETIPWTGPYLFAQEALVAKWRQSLASFAGRIRIGIAWQGNRKYQADHLRSIPLRAFAPLASVPGVTLFSLQKNDGAEQLQDVEQQLAVESFGPDFDVTSGAFEDTAAVMKNMDLIVTSDTAIAHLAGGLGVPVWVALSYCADWRWGPETTQSPWYPTMRLFRQPALGDWEGLFAEMSAAIRETFPHRGPMDDGGPSMPQPPTKTPAAP